MKKGGVKTLYRGKETSDLFPFLVDGLEFNFTVISSVFLIRCPSNSAVIVDMGRGTEGELCVGQANNASCRHHEDRCLGRGDSSGDDKEKD